MNMYGEMHRFIPAVANWYGVKIKEVETIHHPRLRGESKYGISRTLLVILDLITVKFLQNYSTKPMQAFGPFGLACGISGLIVNLYLVCLWLSGQGIGHIGPAVSKSACRTGSQSHNQIVKIGRCATGNLRV